MTVLGKDGISLHLSLYAIRAFIPKETMRLILAQTIRHIGMDSAGMEPAAWDYPLPTGQGGTGETICQPFVEDKSLFCQPLTTSFILSDSWNDCGVTFVILGSCILYDPASVRAYLTLKCKANVEFQGWLVGK